MGAKNEAGAGSATGWRLSSITASFPTCRVGYPSFLYGTPSCAGTLNDRRATVSTIVGMWGGDERASFGNMLAAGLHGDGHRFGQAEDQRAGQRRMVSSCPKKQM